MQQKTSCSDTAVKNASAIVDKAIGEAVAWIASDPAERFLYKYPRECEQRPNNRLRLASTWLLGAEGAATSAKERRSSIRAVTETNTRKRIDWLRIDEFALHQLVQLVYDYLSLWRLTPSTRYQVHLERDIPCKEPQGCTYSLNALFTRQPQTALVERKPLAMTQVKFKVHVSDLLPKFYPIMMTYRFENSNMDYYALGNRRLRRLDFQRFFIDMALEAKLGFYAQLLGTLAFGPQPSCAPEEQKSKRDETIKEDEDKALNGFCLCTAEASKSRFEFE